VYPNCASGKTCGHYTQVIWAATREIGCAVNNQCPGQFSSVYICRYNPPGNFLGQAPYSVDGSGGGGSTTGGSTTGGSTGSGGKSGKSGKSGKGGKGGKGKKGKKGK